MIQTSSNPIPDDILDEIMNGTTLGDSKSAVNGSMTDTSDAESDAPVTKLVTTANTKLSTNANAIVTNISTNNSTAMLDDDGGMFTHLFEYYKFLHFTYIYYRKDFDSKIIPSGNSSMDKTKLQ